MVEEVRTDALRVVYLGEPSWDALIAAGLAADGAAVAERSATLVFDDPINIQYTSGTTGFPKARRSRTTTSSTTATSSASSVTTPNRTGSAFRCPSTTASAW
jgi:fatty-acyl-CoA synthase